MSSFSVLAYPEDEGRYGALVEICAGYVPALPPLKGLHIAYYFQTDAERGTQQKWEANLQLMEFGYRLEYQYPDIEERRTVIVAGPWQRPYANGKSLDLSAVSVSWVGEFPLVNGLLVVAEPHSVRVFEQTLSGMC